MIHIHGCRGVSWKLIHRFMNYDSSLSFLYNISASQLASIFAIKKDRSEKILKDLHKSSPSDVSAEYTEKNIRVITLLDETYPAYLKEIFDPPWVLYCIGDLSIFHHEKMLSVVGTRRPSRTGVQALKKLLQPLVDEDWTIVSGLAYGIDAEAHRIALKSGTIAVLGSGFDYIYPKQHKTLARQIAQAHLLVSEYPPDKQAKPWQFPYRNRIISGLAKGTLVVEAKEKSGTLITADQALEQGREVFAVPGSILEPCFYGTNRLIQQGAKLVLDSNDIIGEWYDV
jgi:DNA processing protein